MPTYTHLSFRAVGTSLELLQTRQQSKEDTDGAHARFPDKNLQFWNGRAPVPPINHASCRVRVVAITSQYRAQVCMYVCMGVGVSVGVHVCMYGCGCGCRWLWVFCMCVAVLTSQYRAQVCGCGCGCGWVWVWV